MAKNNVTIKRISFISLSVLLLFVLISQVLFSQTTINVDISKETKNINSVVGFLHFNNLKPLKKDLVAIKPNYWRVGNTLIDEKIRKEQLNILKQNNITPILVITDFYSHRNPNWKKPYLDKEGFVKLVEDLYRENGNSVIYNIWNEPNHEFFFDGNRQDFFEIFQLAHNKIRSLPNGKKAKIMGPSTAGFYKEYIEDFLDFSNKNKLTVDYLSWHQNGDLKDAFEMKNNIILAKTTYFKKYPNVKIKDFFISEIIGPEDYFNPHTAFFYIYNMDLLRVGGCKTCGPTDKEETGDTCWNNSIDGLITPQGKPRSVWWVYKYYAESLPVRLSTNVDSDRTAAISYFSKDSNSVKILFGNLGKFKSSFSIDLKSVRKFSVFAKSKKINYSLYKIPNTEQKELSNPILIKKDSVSISSKNTISLELDDIDTESVYLLKMTN